MADTSNLSNPSATRKLVRAVQNPRQQGKILRPMMDDGAPTMSKSVLLFNIGSAKIQPCLESPHVYGM